MMTPIAKLARREDRNRSRGRRSFRPALQGLEGRVVLTSLSGAPVGSGPLTTVVSTSPSAR